MRKGLRHIALGMGLSFIFLSFALVYWQVIRTEALQENPANRRLILLEQRVTRGGIFDRNGEILAQTKVVNGQKVRNYPKGEVVEPLIGYATLLHGSAGLEAGVGDWLLGIKDSTPAQELERMFELPRQGDDVVLTLDYNLQKAAYEGLKGKTGTAVAIDPQSGEVLALVSQPAFDPNHVDQDWNDIIKRPGSPLQNHAFSLFPPGSTMKVITSASLLRAGVNPSDLYNCTGTTTINGQVISEQNGKVHGWVNFNTALAESCNTYFSEFGVRSGNQNFLEAARRFGFGKDIPFELPIAKSSITQKAPIPTKLDINLLAASTFGQGEVMVSPFHMALVAAGVANQGVIMTPHIVERVLDAEQNVIYKAKDQAWLSALSKDEAEKIKSAMITSVNEGTAAPGSIEGIQVAAKTGSAEPGGDVKTHAWYIAFAPVEKPRIAVAVLVENGGTGGGAAAPIAKQIMQAALIKKAGEKS